MAHVVSDTVSCPTECEFAQIASADYKPTGKICKPKQMTCPFTRLNVFECLVIYRLSVGVRMADITKHLHAARPDIDLPMIHTEGLH